MTIAWTGENAIGAYRRIFTDVIGYIFLHATLRREDFLSCFTLSIFRTNVFVVPYETVLLMLMRKINGKQRFS